MQLYKAVSASWRYIDAFASPYEHTVTLSKNLSVKQSIRIPVFNFGTVSMCRYEPTSLEALHVYVKNEVLNESEKTSFTREIFSLVDRLL